MQSASRDHRRSRHRRHDRRPCRIARRQRRLHRRRCCRSAPAGLACPPAVRVVTESEQVAQIDSKDMDFAIWRRLAEAVARHLARAGGARRRRHPRHRHARGDARTSWRASSPRQAGRPHRGDAAGVVARGRRAAQPRRRDRRRARPPGPGVVVVLAGMVHSARAVRKVHPTRLDAFSSGEQGALARVDRRRLVALRAWPGEAQGSASLPCPRTRRHGRGSRSSPSVAGADGRAVDLLVQGGVAGHRRRRDRQRHAPPPPRARARAGALARRRGAAQHALPRRRARRRGEARRSPPRAT